MMIHQDNILTKAQQNLNDLSDRLNNIQIVDSLNITIKSSDFRSIDSFKNIENIQQSVTAPVIYVISIEDSIEKKDLLTRFYSFEIENKKRIKNTDRINHSRYNKENKDSSTLYVGSCLKTDFKDRLKSHLGLKSGRTYSLHLSKWDKDVEYTMQIKIYQVISTNDIEIERGLLELIEQTIWDELKPIFGKRSGLL